MLEKKRQRKKERKLYSSHEGINGDMKKHLLWCFIVAISTETITLS